MIQNFKCTNCRFTFKFDTTINFLLINDMNMQISRTISKECCSHTHMSQFCDLEIRQCLRNKHTEAGSCAFSGSQRSRLTLHPEPKLGRFTIESHQPQHYCFTSFRSACSLLSIHYLGGINVSCCSHHYHAIILKYTKRLLKPQK